MFMRIRAVLIALAVFCFWSCSSDDEPFASIVGQWNKVSTTTQVGHQAPNTVPYDSNTIGCHKDYWEFGEGEVLRDVVWYKNANEICTEDIDLKTYVHTGDQLTISEPGLTETFTVIRLTGSLLEFQSTTHTGGITLKVTHTFARR